MNAELSSGRTFPVSASIAAPRQPLVQPTATPRAEDRNQQRLMEIERRLDLLDGALATLAGALNDGNGHR